MNQPELDKNRSLIEACWNGKVQEVKCLLAMGADPHFVTSEEIPARSNALNAASCQGHLEIAKVLLESGANPNIRGRNGLTALGFAASLGNLEMVRLLINAGADVKIAYYRGATPLILASREGISPEVIRTLIEAGADVNATDDTGMTALDCAQAFGCRPIIKILKAAGGKKGWRPEPEIPSFLKSRF